MAQNMAPWLEGLDGSLTWESPTKTSASHDAHSIQRQASSKATSQASTQRRRNPLATLSSSGSNSIRRPQQSSQLSQSRSFSGTSDDSVICGTVQHRSKSASPAKKQQTLEWKKRLLGGGVGYGDQTDLFGPSGLENIFAQTSEPSSNKPKVRSSMSWLDGSGAADIPSSPSLWPSRVAQWQREDDSNIDERLTAVAEETENQFTDQDDPEDSFRSNPFALDESDPPVIDDSLPVEDPITSPERLEPTEDNMVDNRTVSGQTDCEDFSPVFISKHTTIDGKTGYKAFDSHFIKKFQTMEMNPRRLSQDESQEETPCPEKPSEMQEQSAFTDGPESVLQLPSAAPDLSLSENLPTGTPPSVAGLGGHVQVKRGGYSAQGSFKERPLSSSQVNLEPSHVRDASGLLSPIVSSGPKRGRPSTPGQECEPQEPRSRSSGSPLKLFGPHDTFTSKRLLRRMSQLDPDLSGISEQQDDERAQKPASRSGSVVSFGSGSLGHHKFNAEITITSASDSDKGNSDRSPGSDVPSPGARSPQMFNFNDSPAPKDTFRLKRRRSAVTSADSTINGTTKSTHLQPTVDDATDLSKIIERPSEMSVAPGKRPSNSPYKAPTPKRRRTLHASELESEAQGMNKSYHEDFQEALAASKATTDKIQDLQEALRPRNPTPSKRRREQITAEIRETAVLFAVEEPEKLEAVMEQLESSMAGDSPPSIQQQARAIANEVAKFSLRVQKASSDMTERKRSVTTQDFFNEAVMVMRLIREKAGRQSGLGSVAESEQEGNSFQEESDSELAALRVSRPPSREGGSGWRSRNSEHTDARVISHLRRFEEKDDTEFIAQSVASLHVDDECNENVFEDDYDHDIVAVDEHSNIRIKRPVHHIRDEDFDSQPSSQRSNQTQSSQHSNATSTGRTIHTASTRKSDNVGTLAPDAVAHLIGEQVGSMAFDKDKQQWVKTKSPEKRQSFGAYLEPPSNLTSDDDPFREISDLPVDERKEEEIRKASSQGRRLSAVPADVAQPCMPETQDFAEQQNPESRTTSQKTVLARPATMESQTSRHAYSSSDPSRYTAFGSSQQQTNETRATSWGDEDLQRLAAQGKLRHQSFAYAAAQVALHQRSNAGTLERPQTRDTQKNFPSPPVSDLPEAASEEDVGDSTLDAVNEQSESELDCSREDTAVDVEHSPVHTINAPKLRSSPNNVQFSSPNRNTTSTRSMSLRRKTLTSRFNQQDDVAQSELSFVAALPGRRMMSVSLSVSRPLSKRQPMGHIMEHEPSSPTKFDPSHILSDLPDFTVQDIDQERPSERALAKRLAKHAADEVNDRYALAVNDLVKTLTDVKADEPYWEELKQLDLHDRGLQSIHGLSDFCGNVQDMDLSNNRLAFLNGTPQTVRNLVARENLLSSLTPWTHLMNLQYLDVSGNQLDSLKGMECLIHLRELRADDNQVTDLDGVLRLDGLLKLRLRRNQLLAVDFGSSDLQRLEQLDLCGNEISNAFGLGTLQRLETLKLDDNNLEAGLEIHGKMPYLRHLSVRNCGLQELDVSCMPALKTFMADENRLETVIGIDLLRSLDILSMRKQDLSVGFAVSLLEQPLHARTVNLSGNDMPALHLHNSLLSLQHLELASCGLRSLSNDFGLQLPNLTSLNLNFNSLRDIRPLLNVQKLESLYVCGNRLDRLRRSVATLSKIATLCELDMRDNPLTQGFYAPLTNVPNGVQTSVIRRSLPAEVENEDEDALHERREAAKHMLPGQIGGERDRTHCDRLDETTKLRRRVCHLMLGHSCPTLKRLDGMRFEKKDAMVKDRIWNRLLELGIMKKSGKVGLRGERTELEATP